VQQPPTTPYPVSDFLEWEAAGQLELAPKFQRRSVWELKARSFLIDTILRSMPIPPLFVRLRLDAETSRSVREVVEGQQRLRTVLDYVRGDFAIAKAHNPDWGGSFYDDLPETARNQILRYKFSVTVLEDMSDSDVLSIFSRLNTYTVPLNSQELRNAEFFGLFKQTVYELALEHYVFWLSNKILTDQNVARMQEAELVSELLVTMLDGIRATRAGDLREFYRRYDDDFPQSREIKQQFQATIDLIGEIYGDNLGHSFFRRKPAFYTLFVALFDARFGLPDSSRRRITFAPSIVRRLRGRLGQLEETLAQGEPPDSFRQFLQDTRYATADVGRRRARHKFMWANVLDNLK
jgi:hypothetical protein